MLLLLIVILGYKFKFICKTVFDQVTVSLAMHQKSNLRDFKGRSRKNKWKSPNYLKIKLIKQFSAGSEKKKKKILVRKGVKT